jgi:hypothetical protein
MSNVPKDLKLYFFVIRRVCPITTKNPANFFRLNEGEIGRDGKCHHGG